MSLTVKILSSEDFDKLPFKRAKEALGAADAKSGIAYVRDTGFNDITKHTIEHELDELMQKVSPHEEDGIRYKIGGDLLSGIGNLLGKGASAVGKGAASVGNFLTPGPEIFGAGANAASAGLPAAPKFQSIIGSQAGGPNLAASSSLPNFSGGSILPTGAAASGGIENILSAISGGGGGGGFPGFPSTGGPSAAAPAPSFLDSILSGGGDLLKGAFTPRGTGGEDGTEGGVLDIFKRAAPGLLLPLLGNAFADDVTPPDFSGITGPLSDRITGEGGAGSDAFNLGFGEAKRTIDAPLGEVPEGVFGQSEKLRDQQLGDDLKQLRNQFKALNPTADVENNSAFLREKSRLEERAREDKANARAALSFEFTNQEMGRRLNTMQTLLNLDSAQTEQLIRLAQLDVSEILIQTGLEVEEANQIKQLFGDFGQILLQNQFPQQQQETT